MAFIFSVLKAVINCSIRSSAFASSQDSSPPKTEKLKLKLCLKLYLKLSFKLYLKLFFKLKLKLRIQEMDMQKALNEVASIAAEQTQDSSLCLKTRLNRIASVEPNFRNRIELSEFRRFQLYQLQHQS